jgi:hypothetical protein
MPRSIAYFYLCLVPLIAFILAFTTGRVAPEIYVPIWIAHALLMLYFLWQLGAKHALQSKGRSRSFVAAAMLLVLPWILATIFAGMGPPPFNMAGWAELAGEQRFRFGILVVCGLSLAGAFSLLKGLAESHEKAFYACIAFTAILIAMPVFIVVMAFWGTVFTDTAIVVATTHPQTNPEWLAPWRHMIDFLSTVEVCLFYLGTAFLAIAMRKAKWFSLNATRVYFFVSLFAIAATLIPASAPEPLVILNYVAGIPAITMMMPYLMGLALLKRVEVLESDQ